VRFAKAINLITPAFLPAYAVGLPSRRVYRDADAIFDKGTRLLFVTPWRGHSMIGTAYAVYDDTPEKFQVTAQDVQDFLNDLNQAYPSANLQREDVVFVHGGLLPMSGIDRKTGDVQLLKHHRIYDHRHDGVPGFISVLGVKYTTARYVAERVIDYVLAMWGRKSPPSLSAITPLHGGEIEQFAVYLHTEAARRPHGLEAEAVHRLIYNYGSAYRRVLQYMDPSPTPGKALLTGQAAVLRAEIRHGIHEEMAQKLSDIVLRRTELGTIGHPGKACLHTCAEVMGAELGWSLARTQQELHDTEVTFTTGKET
jgi:glycerol-3-phosphate dehydrogenase